MNEFSSANEVQSNWVALKEVGDIFKGTLVDQKVKLSNDADMPNQMVYEFVNASVGTSTIDSDENIVDPKLNLEGDVLFGIKEDHPFIVPRMSKFSIGDIVGIALVKIAKPSKPGRNGAKMYKVFNLGRDAKFDEADIDAVGDVFGEEV